MCGIAGIVGPNKAGISVNTLLNRIAHRGPDGLFYWHGHNVALGHGRLSIIDLSQAANQPMIDHSTGNVIIFNGEIYNYLELREQFSSQYDFKTNSDTEVILAAYKLYGVNMFSRLRGMFAFAIYDAYLKKVLIARDRLGIKPLVYRTMNGSFYFSSEIKSLINHENTEERLNEIKVYEFLADARMDADEFTFLDGIRYLPAASYMWVNDEGKADTPLTFWDFPELGNRKFDTAAKEEFIEKMDENIKLHLRSDVPVGTFLSGGLDSSSVTCFALKNLKQDNLNVFSAILPYYHPENALINDVADADSRIIKNELLLNGDTFFEDITKVIYQNGSPILDGSVYTHYKLCEMAKQKNIKVLLSGSGGDELFGGYESIVHAQHARLLYQRRFGKYAYDLVKFRKARMSNTYSHLLLKSLYECTPVSMRRFLKNKQLHYKFNHISIKPTVSHYYHTHRDPFVANMLNMYKSWTAPPFLHYEDRNSMKFGIEIRVPFFDHKLIEYILQFNTDEIISGSSKSIIRNSFRGIVPDNILNQKGKYGFPSPLDHILRNDETGKAIFYDLYKKTPLLRKEETLKLAEAFYNGKGDVSVFWRTLSYMIWYHLYKQN